MLHRSVCVDAAALLQRFMLIHLKESWRQLHIYIDVSSRIC